MKKGNVLFAALLHPPKTIEAFKNRTAYFQRMEDLRMGKLKVNIRD